jgi:hypothetical protein
MSILTPLQLKLKAFIEQCRCHVVLSGVSNCGASSAAPSRNREGGQGPEQKISQELVLNLDRITPYPEGPKS